MKLPIKYSKSHWTVRKQARDNYTLIQGGACWYCRKPLDGGPSDEVANAKINRRLFPEGMFKYPVHLHHDHTTDDTIGAVHSRCNAYLWQYKGE